MSIYEKYYSKINKEYIFSILKNIIKEEYKIDISGNFVFKDYYETQLDNNFKNNNSDNIAELNKILIDSCIKYFSNNFIEANTGKISVNEYEELINNRENIFNNNSENDDKNFLNDDNKNFLNNYEEVISSYGESEINEYGNKLLKDNNENDLLTNDENSINDESNIIDDKKEINIVSNYKPYTFNSIKRTNLQSSRYNYKIRNGKDWKINHLSKLFIPIENNHIFSMPVLKIHFPDFKEEIILERKEKIEHNKRIYGIYEPIEKIILPKIDIEKIRIKITDISDIEYNHNDILSVNILEVKGENLYFTCSNIYKNDYSPGDFIKVINNRSRKLDPLFTYPLKIKRIKENLIICEVNDYCEHEECNLTNIDMKLINISNQNIIYFNL